jgi:lipopolysaccharide export system permease protein
MPPVPEEQTLSQLRAEITEAKRQRRPSKNLEISYQVRFSTPAACIVFALFAPAVAIKFGKSGFAGVLLSIVLVGIYYNAFILTTEILGKNGSLPASPAAWLPDICFAVMGLLAIRRLE